MKKKLIFIVCIVLICIFAFCGRKQQVEETTAPNNKSEKKEEIKRGPVTMLVLGDNLFHMPVVNSGRKDDGTYEYSHLYEHFQPEISETDIAVIGQETVFGGEKYGYSGYPLFNSPEGVGVTLAKEGFDVVLHASNHALDKWAEGLENTMEFWKQYPEVTTLGINESFEDRESVDIMEKNGIKLALLNYTYDTNGLRPVAGKEYIVNYIDRDKIKKDIEYSEENADITVAFMHWGIDNAVSATNEQKDLAKYMCSLGADLIVGSHPHVLQGAEWIESDNGNRAFVYYSLGNYVSRQIELKNLLGGIASVTIDDTDGKVRVTKATVIPHVTHYNAGSNEFDVYPLSDYTDEMAALHGVARYDGRVTMERLGDILDRAFEGYDINIIEK